MSSDAVDAARYRALKAVLEGTHRHVHTTYEPVTQPVPQPIGPYSPEAITHVAVKVYEWRLRCRGYTSFDAMVDATMQQQAEELDDRRDAYLGD